MVFHHYLWSLFLHFDIVLLMFHMLFSIDQYFHIIDLCFSPAGLNASHYENEVELIVQRQIQLETLFDVLHYYL